VRVHIDDGRNFLLTTRESYDIITFEPMPLALAGVSTFYTEEYYRLCLARLSPGGMVSQWVPLHSLNPAVVRSLVFTFTSVFPEYCACFINADLFLIGSNQPLRIDYPALTERLSQPAIKTALDAVGLRDPAEVAAGFIMDKAALDAYAAGGRAMSDDRPWAEFLAPKLVYLRTVQDTLAEIQPHVTSPAGLLTPNTSPEDAAVLERRHQAHRNDLAGLRLYYGGMAIGQETPDAFKQSLDIDPQDFNAQYYLKEIVKVQGEQMLHWEQFDDGEKILVDALRYLPDDPDLLRILRDTYQAQGKDAPAREISQRLSEIVDVHPE
jgi:tetratricopeptide (TPR) repeat protein